MARFMRRGEAERPLKAATSRLISDAEEFLSGGYENHLGRHNDPVPAWARLNVLAHGDLGSLRDIAEVVSNDWPEGLWRTACRLLAQELLAVVRDDSAMLSRLQHATLIPLELYLMDAEVDQTVGPLELVQLTRAALRSSIA